MFLLTPSETKIQACIDQLQQRFFKIIRVNTLSEAKEELLAQIPKGSSIGLGGSVTLNDLDILEEFRKEHYNLYDRYNQKDWPATVINMRNSLDADYFVTGTNAIIQDGCLLQMDSGGNRVAAMVYGPKNVIVITGINKIVSSLEEGFERLTRVAVINSKRLNHQTPCNFSGICEDCIARGRICNATTIISSGKRPKGKTIIILINQEVGY